MDDKIKGVIKQIGELRPHEKLMALHQLFEDISVDDEIVLLLPAVSKASGYTQWRVKAHLANQDTPDLLSLLPSIIHLQILKYVDGPSLLNACKVSTSWRRILTSLQTLWKSKCRLIGVNMGTTLKDICWHQVFVSAMKRLHSLKSDTAFSKKFMSLQNCKKAVQAVDYQHGYLCTVSEEDYVNIWQLELNIPLLTFPVSQVVSCIKFKPNSQLVCGHFTGILTSYDIRCMGEAFHMQLEADDEGSPLMKCTFRMHSAAVFSCDFSEALDLLVSGGGDGCIKLWSLGTGHLLRSVEKHSDWVLKVILMPAVGNCTKHMIISMRTYSISKLVWSSENNRTAGAVNSCLKNANCDEHLSKLHSKHMGDIDNISNHIFLELKGSCVGSHFYTPGIHVTSEYLGLVVQDPDEKKGDLLVYDIKSLCQIYHIPLPFKVKKLLALGNRFALMLTPGSILFTSKLIIFDFLKSEMIGSSDIPHSKMTTPDGSQLVVGDLEWLNGLPVTSNIVPSSDYHKKLKSTKRFEQDKLVLAAGVQSEPGRLFTLQWKSHQDTKCKEE